MPGWRGFGANHRGDGVFICGQLGLGRNNKNGERMSVKKAGPDLEKLDRIVAEARRNQEERERGYREQALRMYPWICGRCAREFTLKNLRELTVHHKDHNHDNNPPDGSNWELLCLYCHDNEHSRYLNAEISGGAKPGGRQDSNTTFKAFANLGALLKGDK